MRIAGSEYFKTMAMAEKIDAQTNQSRSGGIPTTDPLLDSGSSDPLLNAGSGNPLPGLSNSNSGRTAKHTGHAHPSSGRPNSNEQPQNNSAESTVDSSGSARRGGRIHEIV
jgi:hypothetical protein